MSSLWKKYVMAITGFILVGFVAGHMLGNLQMFLHPDWINEYGYKLKTLPYGLLWIVRLGLLATIVLHFGTAFLLWKENKAARPSTYEKQRTKEANLASMSMYLTGPLLLFFIVFHILHFTVRNIHPEFAHLETELAGVGTMHHVYDKLAPLGHTTVHDIYSMVAIGFSPKFWYVSVFYILGMGALMLHLSHGVAAMFQSLGLRNAEWKPRLKVLAYATGAVLFVGFASIPVAGLLQAYPHSDKVDWAQFDAQGHGHQADAEALHDALADETH